MPIHKICAHKRRKPYSLYQVRDRRLVSEALGGGVFNRVLSEGVLKRTWERQFKAGFGDSLSSYSTADTNIKHLPSCGGQGGRYGRKNATKDS